MKQLHELLDGSKSPIGSPTGSLQAVSVWLLLLIGSETCLAGEPGLVVVNDVVVEFAATVDVPSRQSGAVAEIGVVQNQWVSKGQRVAKLDDTALVIRRRVESLRQESARLVLKDNLEIQFAETALDEAKSELEDSQAASDRVSGAVARNQVRRTKLAVDRSELELARAQKLRRQAEIDLQLRAADLAMIEYELSLLECVAPIDGIVLNVHRDLGEWAAAGEPMVTIADAAVLHLHALVDADVLDPSRCVGLPVSVGLPQSIHGVVPNDARQRDEMLRGRIISVDPIRLPGNRIRVHAEVENRRNGVASANSQAPGLIGDGWQLAPGMKVTMSIHCSDIDIARRKMRAASGSLR